MGDLVPLKRDRRLPGIADDGSTFTRHELRVALVAFSIWAGMFLGREVLAVDKFFEETT